MKCHLAILGERYTATLKGQVSQMDLSPYMVVFQCPKKTKQKTLELGILSRWRYNAKASDSFSDILCLSWWLRGSTIREEFTQSLCPPMLEHVRKRIAHVCELKDFFFLRRDGRMRGPFCVFACQLRAAHARVSARQCVYVVACHSLCVFRGDTFTRAL